VRFEGLIREAGEPKKSTVLAPLDCPKAVTSFLEASLDPLHGCVALGAAQRPQEVAHHVRIRVEAGEGVAIGLPPAPQDEARGREREHGGASMRFRRPSPSGSQRPAAARMARSSGSCSA